MELNEQQFRNDWKVICYVWKNKKYNHGLRLGCGRRTFSHHVANAVENARKEYGEKIRNSYGEPDKYIFYLSPPLSYNHSYLRRVLIEGVKRGWAMKTRSEMGYSCFVIFC